MIDFYDVLGIGLNADADEIRKAFKKMSLQNHPDKVQASNSGADSRIAGDKFNEVLLARDVLADPERRKIYDAFGVDLGEEKPEMEVWNIGMTMILSPLGGFALKTVVLRLALWFISWWVVALILLLVGAVAMALYAMAWTKIRDPDNLPILLYIAIVDVVILLQWLWPLLADTVGLFYLVSEIVGIQVFLENWKVGAGAGFASLVVSWLARGWWFWILGLEAALLLLTLASLTVAAGIMHLWMENVQTQRSEKLRAWRYAMRLERNRMQDEIAQLKRKLEGHKSEAPPPAAEKAKVPLDKRPFRPVGRPSYS